MIGDEFLPKRSPDKYQRLVMVNYKGIYQVEYSVRNSLDKLKHFNNKMKIGATVEFNSLGDKIKGLS